jgi:hypothetical protein
MGLWTWIRRDGLLHMESCALIAIAVGLVLPWWIAGLVALAAGLGKEVWDLEHEGVANWHDVVCDFIGAIVGIVIVVL